MTDVLTREDLEAIKGRQQATWASGDYAVIGTTLQIVGENLCEAVDIVAGSQVLDVAAGNGNASLAAARRGCVGDRHRLRRGAARREPRRRAEAEGLTIDDAGRRRREPAVRRRRYDAVAVDVRRDVRARPRSAPRPRWSGCAGPAAASASPTGRPRASSAGCSRSSAPHVPPPAGVPSPLRVGTPERLDELFGADAKVEATRRALRVPLPVGRGLLRDVQDLLRADRAGVGRTRRGGPGVVPTQLIALANERNRDTSGALAVPSEYLEVVAHVTG